MKVFGRMLTAYLIFLLMNFVRNFFLNLNFTFYKSSHQDFYCFIHLKSLFFAFGFKIFFQIFINRSSERFSYCNSLPSLHLLLYIIKTILSTIFINIFKIFPKNKKDWKNQSFYTVHNLFTAYSQSV